MNLYQYSIYFNNIYKKSYILETTSFIKFIKILATFIKKSSINQIKSQIYIYHTKNLLKNVCYS